MGLQEPAHCIRASLSSARRRNKISCSDAELLAHAHSFSRQGYLKGDHCIKFRATEFCSGGPWRAVVHLIQSPTLALLCPIVPCSIVLLA